MFPPKAKLAVLVPDLPPASSNLAVFKSLSSVQDVPFQDSVFPTLGPPYGVAPPKASAAVLVAPLPANKYLA